MISTFWATPSPNAEVELIDVTTRALLNIGFTGFTVNINDRRILRAMLEKMGFAANQLDSVCISFDKMDKIGAEGVKAELTEKQLPEAAIHALADFIAAGDVTLDAVAARCADPAIADDLKYVLATAHAGCRPLSGGLLPQSGARSGILYRHGVRRSPARSS